MVRKKTFCEVSGHALAFGEHRGAVVLTPRSVRGSSGPSLSSHSQSVVTPWSSVTFGGVVVSDPRSVCVDHLNGFLWMSEKKVVYRTIRSSPQVVLLSELKAKPTLTDQRYEPFGFFSFDDLSVHNLKANHILQTLDSSTLSSHHWW